VRDTFASHGLPSNIIYFCRITWIYSPVQNCQWSAFASLSLTRTHCFRCVNHFDYVRLLPIPPHLIIGVSQVLWQLFHSY